MMCRCGQGGVHDPVFGHGGTRGDVLVWYWWCAWPCGLGGAQDDVRVRKGYVMSFSRIVVDYAIHEGGRAVLARDLLPPMFHGIA